VRSYGKLVLHRDVGLWVIPEIEPHVVIKLKSIYQGIRKTQVAPFTFQDTPEFCREISWFIDRFPLAISSLDLAHLHAQRDAHITRLDDLERIARPDYKPKEFKLKLPLRDYQAQGLEIYLKNGALLVGDPVGVGKTPLAVGSFTQPELLPAVVVVQTHLPTQWRDQIAKFTDCSVHLVKGTKPYSLPPADVYIMKYSCLAGWSDIYGMRPFKSVVFDEIQELRKSDSQKYLAAKNLSKTVSHVLGLSATPIYNKGAEIYNILNLMKEGCLGRSDDFMREWAGWGDTVKDPKALGTHLREQFLFIRRTREEVGRELPPTNVIIEPVGHDEEAVKNIEELAKKLALKATTGSFVERGQAARELDIMVRQVTGVSKAKYVAEYVKVLLEAGEPVVLAGWHRDCFARGTRVMRYDGTSVPVEEVAVGDLVMGPDSGPRRVLSLVRGSGKMLKVTPKKGKPFVCSEGHILTLSYNNKRKFKIVDITASEFAKKSDRARRNYTLMRSDQITFPSSGTVFEPWLLGYWLGNGDSRLAMLGIATMDAEVEDKFQTIADRHDLLVRKYLAPGRTGASEAFHLRLSCGKGNGFNRVLSEFRDLGLKRNKHIPVKYKTASIQERRELLAGLLDSDGHVYRNGCGAEFSNTNKRLAEDVEWLCRSLGLAAYLSGPFEVHSGYGKKDGSVSLAYRVSISGDLSKIPVISRKRPDARRINKNVLRVGFEIESVGVDHFYGFETDGDHLFLLDDFTIVHNCYEIWLKELAAYRPVMYTGTESPTQKNEAKEAFVSGKTNLFIISLRSGVGLDGLQERGSLVVIGELDWSPAVHEQLIGRLRRDGQKNQVTAIYCVSDSGSDPPMIDLLGLKASQAQGIVDPNSPLQAQHSDESRIKLLAQRYLDKSLTVRTDANTVQEHASQNDQTGRAQLSPVAEPS
jgi:hypothetical protein